ncbi:Phosphomethylpyrimidine kinase-domain-containing protein [Phlyctochytrium arcticum]|nr:Phosphomethylpyrimidine kinase-domain-containing protein [Phlyctochytrium arcticum]
MLTAAPKIDMTVKALTIAGSDSGGGAGIQADLKTFTALEVYGSSVLTALTAQNTLGVQGVHAVPKEFVEQQIRCVLDDIGCNAVKTGMLYDAEIISTVARVLKEYNSPGLIVDPVMISTSGSRLLSADALSALQELLIPIAECVTPNVPEAEVLSGIKITSLQDVRNAAKKIYAFGCKTVLIKGGHLPVDASGNPIDPSDPQSARGALVVDTFYNGEEFIEFRNKFLVTKNTHGTGCTLSAAMVAYLAKGLSITDAIEQSMLVVARGLENSFAIGNGAGPLNHFASVINPNTSRALTSESFLQLLRSSSSSEWSQYVNHPFVLGLADGTLPIESFKHFIRQDYIFLKHYARAHALASYREHEMEDIVKGAQIVAIIGEECQMHIHYCAEWGISLDELESTREATPNLAYTRYVLDRGMSGDRLDLRVALAPCLLGYGEIGLRLANSPKTKREGNPYWTWIENYAKPAFQEAVREGEELLEKLFKNMVREGDTKRVEQLCDTFRIATVLEGNFFEMGHSLVL